MTEDERENIAPAQLPVAPAQICQAALAELESLARFIPELTLDDWEKPSAVPAWTIGEVVAHLNLVLGLYSRVLDAGLAGRGSGSMWRAFGDVTKRIGPAAAPAFNAINNAVPRLVEGTLSPETIKGQFAASSRRFRERVARIGPTDYGRPLHYMGRAWPLSYFLAVTVNELAIHGWDMRSRLDPEAHLSSEVRAVLPWFYWSGTPIMFRPPTGLRGTVQALLVDPSVSMWWSIDAEGVKQGIGEVKADVTLSGESGTFVLVLAGRFMPKGAMRATSISADRDEDMASAFLKSWKLV